jgi:hypothetical protein
MQSGGHIEGTFFQDICENLKHAVIKGTGHIIISYNENNEYIVMNTVYPSLTTKRIPYKLPGDQCKEMDQKTFV